MSWWEWVVSGLVWLGCVLAVVSFVVHVLVAALFVRLWHDGRVPGEGRAGSRRHLRVVEQ